MSFIGTVLQNLDKDAEKKPLPLPSTCRSFLKSVRSVWVQGASISPKNSKVKGWNGMLFAWLNAGRWTPPVWSSLGLEKEIPVRTFKQEEKPMIYVLSSPHLHSANAHLDGNHEGKPRSEMSFLSSLFSALPFGCKTHWNGNLMLLDSEKQSQVLL